MTTEKILQELVNMKTGEDIGSVYVDKCKYTNLVEELKQAIRDENNKKAGKSNLAKLGKAVLKNAVKITGGKNQNTRSMMRYAHTKDGVQYVLDSHRIAWFYNPIDLPEWNEKDGNWYQIDRLVTMEVDDTPLELPTIGEIKAEMKARKLGRYQHLIYVFDNGLTINPQYLLDYMEAFPDMKVYRSASKNYKREPLWIEAEEGGGVLLPVNGEDREKGFYVI